MNMKRTRGINQEAAGKTFANSNVPVIRIMFRHSRVFLRTAGGVRAAGTRWQAAADGLRDSKTQFWKAGEFRVAALLFGRRGRS